MSSGSTSVCNCRRVFTTQIGLQNVTAHAPAKTLRDSAFKDDGIFGKYWLRGFLDDSYLREIDGFEYIHKKMNPSRRYNATKHDLYVKKRYDGYQTSFP